MPHRREHSEGHGHCDDGQREQRRDPDIGMVEARRLALDCDQAYDLPCEIDECDCGYDCFCPGGDDTLACGDGVRGQGEDGGDEGDSCHFEDDYVGADVYEGQGTAAEFEGSAANHGGRVQKGLVRRKRKMGRCELKGVVKRGPASLLLCLLDRGEEGSALC